MTIYSTDREFSFNAGNEYVVVAVRANGGSVSLFGLMSDGYEIPLEDGVINEDKYFPMPVSGGVFRIRVSGGATYELSGKYQGDAL